VILFNKLCGTGLLLTLSETRNERNESWKKEPLRKRLTPSTHSAAEHVVAQRSVEVFDPLDGGCWYSGLPIDPLYLRKCVKDLASAVIQQFMEPKHQFAHLYVISGGSGIGKAGPSTTLLRFLFRRTSRSCCTRGLRDLRGYFRRRVAYDRLTLCP
jgi:hypothetical protein